MTSLTAGLCLGEVRVATGDALRAAVRKPQPEYNPMAKQMRIQGEVEVEVKINDAGDVNDVKVVSGNPLLTAPVVRSVKDWKFTPFQQDGKASAAVTQLKFTFKMN